MPDLEVGPFDCPPSISLKRMTERKLLCSSDHSYFQEEGGAERPGLTEFLEGVANSAVRGDDESCWPDCCFPPYSALCTFLEPESCFAVCGGRGPGAAGGWGNSLCLSERPSSVRHSGGRRPDGRAVSGHLWGTRKDPGPWL